MPIDAWSDCVLEQGKITERQREFLKLTLANAWGDGDGKKIEQKS